MSSRTTYPLDLDTRPVMRRCASARAALGELKQSVELIPNPSMLINALPVLEARASSEIEHIVTTSDELFRHMDASSAVDSETKEALRYRDALIDGRRSLRDRPLSTGTAERVCSRLLDRDVRVRRVPGTALTDRGTRSVVYTPPVGEDRLRTLLGDWERFLHEREAFDPLVRMAAGHYQFEAIHPFTDGNGRTGRVLNILFLVQSGLLPEPVLYLSRYLIAHRDRYYDLLLAVTRDAAWEEWMLFMLEGVEETARWTVDRIAAIRALSDHTADRVRTRLPKIYSRELVDVIFERPYSRISDVVDAGIVERQAASRYLKALAEVGVLREEKVGREKLFGHPKLLELLEGEGEEHGFVEYG